MPGIDRTCVTHHNACDCHQKIYDELLDAAKFIAKDQHITDNTCYVCYDKITKAIAAAERIKP